MQTGQCGPGEVVQQAAVGIGRSEICAPVTYSCPPWRWLGCFWGGEGAFCAAPSPEAMLPRFHPVPTRPVFAPPGVMPPFSATSLLQGMDDRPGAGPKGRPFKVEVLPPAPVPEEISRPPVEPRPEPAPEDRMTGLPPSTAGPAAQPSWIFPLPADPAVGRVASYPDRPGRSEGSFRR